MTKLYNLQTLKLNVCPRLCKLPQGIGKMINLRHLEIECTGELSYLPQGIGRLTSLRTLSKFIVGGADGGGCKIGQLKDLSLLRGNLQIIRLGGVADVNEANEAELKNKQHLHSMDLSFHDSLYGNDPVEAEIERIEGVLEGLQPHKNLEHLQIRWYTGSKFPSWMVDSVLPKLVVLELINCNNCVQFPVLGKFPFLEKLRIIEMDRVTKFTSKDFGGIVGRDGLVTVFPHLKELSLKRMFELEEWEMSMEDVAAEGRDHNVIIMPCLHTLKLSYCMKLKKLPHQIFPATLRELKIHLCPKLTWTPCLPPLLEKLILMGEVGVLSTSLPIPGSSNHLKSLIIESSPYSLLPQGLVHLTALQSLKIGYSDSLMCMSEELRHLTSLRELEIRWCYVLGRRCQKGVGEDWSIICHIPNIIIDCKIQ